MVTSMTVSQDTLEVILVRTFEVPRILLWQACTDARYISKWWGPKRLIVRAEELDVRSGGSWKFVARNAEEEAFEFHGALEEVIPETKLITTFAFDEDPEHIIEFTLLFEELPDDKSALATTARFLSLDCMEQVDKGGWRLVAEESYERLADLVASAS